MKKTATCPAWQPRFSTADVQVEQDTVICQSFYQMRRLTVRHARFAGGDIEVSRDLCWRPNAVCVLLYDPDKDVVALIEQFRIGAIDHPRSPWLLELVAGLIEPGETAAEVAHRESQEEANAVVRQLELITRFTPSPGGVREYIDLYCGQVDSSTLGGVHGLAEEGEDILVHTLSSTAAFALLQQGVIDNAPAIIALQWLQLNLQRIQQLWGSNT